jgi:hypothetical protein
MVILLIPLGRALSLRGYGLKAALLLIYVEDIVRWGVWLGRHIC